MNPDSNYYLSPVVKEIIKIHDLEFEQSIAASTIQERVRAIASLLNDEYQDKNPLFLGVLNGAFLFMADLFKCMDIPSQISFIKVVSYNGTASSGSVRNLIGLSENIAGRHVVIVEDIVDTGDTMKYLFDELEKQNPASVRLATLLFKPHSMKHNMKPDYTGFEIDPDFVVGYGLDYHGYGRNLNDIYILKQT